MSKETLDKTPLSSIKVIGTPRGNQDFFSEQYKIPLNQFHEGDLDNLLKMLKVNRIDAFIFERASTMGTLKKLKIGGVNYRTLDIIGASFGMRKDAKGTELKGKMDKAIKKIDLKKLFKSYDDYTSLPARGIVQIN